MEYGHALRFYIQFEEGELERVNNGGVIEIALFGIPQMYPVAVQVLGGEVAQPDIEDDAVEIDKTLPETQEKEVVESTPENSGG
jgi:hypothetical protein